jgi:hypothetical protein
VTTYSKKVFIDESAKSCVAAAARGAIGFINTITLPSGMSRATVVELHSLMATAHEHCVTLYRYL